MNPGSCWINGPVPVRRQTSEPKLLLLLMGLCVTIILGLIPGYCLLDQQLDTRLVTANSRLYHSQDGRISYRGLISAHRGSTVDSLAENLVSEAATNLGQDESTAETIFGTKIESNSSNFNGSSPDVGYCGISSTIRDRIVRVAPSRNMKWLTRKEGVLEKVLVCSQIDELDYHEMDKRIGQRANVSIQQIHIVSSESSFVLTAVDLICDRLDCSNLTVFNISGHELNDLNLLPARLASWSQLEIVDLSDTSLKTMKALVPVDSKTTILTHLTHLHLNSNRINELDFNFIYDRMPNLRYLSLPNNTIHNIHCNESLRPRLVRQFEYINLAGNVINCNKTTQMWLLKHIQNPTTSSIFPDSDKINCTLSNLNEITWSQRISVLETKICDICDCHSAKKTALQVDCRNKSLTALPDVLPLNTRILNLTMNHITSLGVPENAKNWENVTYVHLEDNRISSFQQLELNSKFIRNLVALDIRRNKFQEFPSHILEQFVNLDQVHLSDNPWVCDCESTFAFQEWLQRQFHKVGDKEEIRCGMSGNDVNGLKSNSLQQRLSSRVIYKLSKSELCPQDTLERPIDWLDIVNISLGLAIVFILIKVLMDYIYQHRTKRLPHFFKLNI